MTYEEAEQAALTAYQQALGERRAENATGAQESGAGRTPDENADLQAQLDAMRGERDAYGAALERIRKTGFVSNQDDAPHKIAADALTSKNKSSGG